MSERMNCCCGDGRICPSHGDSTPEERKSSLAAPPGSAASKWTRYHMRLCVRGAIRNQMFGGLQHNDGRPMTRDEAFDALCDCLKLGKEYVPIGECDNWDEEKGCLGHPKRAVERPS